MGGQVMNSPARTRRAGFPLLSGEADKQIQESFPLLSQQVQHVHRPRGFHDQALTGTVSSTVYPSSTVPETAPSWRAPPSSPKTLSEARLTCWRF
jgi:hypothetical protein